MAKLNFDDGAVWDNTVVAADKYTTKVSGHGGLGQAQAFVATGRLRGLEAERKPLVIVTGEFDFDASYPTGGEDIAELWEQFPNAFVDVLIEQPNVAAAKTVQVDTVNKKLKAFTDGFVTEVLAAVDLSAIVGQRFVAWGN